jgi:hypothetical protein
MRHFIAGLILLVACSPNPPDLDQYFTCESQQIREQTSSIPLVGWWACEVVEYMGVPQTVSYTETTTKAELVFGYTSAWVGDQLFVTIQLITLEQMEEELRRRGSDSCSRGRNATQRSMCRMVQDAAIQVALESMEEYFPMWMVTQVEQR